MLMLMLTRHSPQNPLDPGFGLCWSDVGAGLCSAQVCLGQDDCCTPGNLCGEGEGDCDDDSDCFGPLVCGSNNCNLSVGDFTEDDDCCQLDGSGPTTAATATPTATATATATATVPLTTQEPCKGGDPQGNCCTPERPCEEGDGDCDFDQDCAAGLLCGVNNCDKTNFPSFDDDDDCCTTRSKAGRSLSRWQDDPCGEDAELHCGNPWSSDCSCVCDPGFVGDGVCCLPDSDGDGAFDEASFCTPSNSGPDADNCPFVPNSNQDDADNDGQGDSCDMDDDNDGIQDTNDNCKAVINTNQEDTDNDGVGNVCDNCPLNANTDQADEDGDGNGDICDLDNDKDFNLDMIDNCPEDYNPNQEDLDGDGVGDECDNCPEESNANQEDVNNNNIGDDCESMLDEDMDGVDDNHDNCPSRPNADQLDTDEDGLGDECDDDCDGDGIADVDDNCCCQPNPNQTPSSYSQRGAVCTADFDGDGVIDSEDICPEDRTKWTTSFKDVSFHDMGQTSTNPSAVWEIHNNGLEVAQLAKSRASMALSDTSFGPVRFSGYLYIVGEDEGIEGAAGLVFNYQNNKNFNLLTAVRTGP